MQEKLQSRSFHFRVFGNQYFHFKRFSMTCLILIRTDKINIVITDVDSIRKSVNDF